MYPNTTPRPTVQLVFSAGSGIERFLSQYGQSAEAGGIFVSGGKKSQDDESSANSLQQPIYKVGMLNFLIPQIFHIIINECRANKRVT